MNLTILIKTFKRPEISKRLIDSIKFFYPNVPMIVLDDPDDMGVSAGRNELVRQCNTEYCMILDDDCIFTADTDLERCVAELEDRGLDILQLDYGEEYYGTFVVNGDTVKMSRFPYDSINGLYEFCAQIFIAKTDKLRECQWDEVAGIYIGTVTLEAWAMGLRTSVYDEYGNWHYEDKPSDFSKHDYLEVAKQFIKLYAI